MSTVQSITSHTKFTTPTELAQRQAFFANLAAFIAGHKDILDASPNTFGVVVRRRYLRMRSGYAYWVKETRVIKTYGEARAFLKLDEARPAA